MSLEVSDDCRYLESHEWARRDGDAVHVGLDDYAQDELGDIVFVELPEAGDEVSKGDSFGVVESVKAVSDVYAPVGGEITDVNDELFDAPELINEDPFGDGWLIEIELADESEYEDLVGPDEWEEDME
ncbi:MAG: glycine cleavage system H protein [Halobacteriales archaeon]|jgi:glycine cleavage system H protein